MPRDRVVSGPPDAMRNPLVIARIEDEVKQGMQRKGYTPTDPMSADLVVDFTVGARERIDVRSHPGGWGPGPVWPGGPLGSDIDVCQYREGTLVIDVFRRAYAAPRVARLGAEGADSQGRRAIVGPDS
jgi:hypothetical protein